jgi:hypothetical protein
MPTTSTKKPLATPIGKGIYPNYDALWHLEALGLGVAASLSDPKAAPPAGWADAVANPKTTRVVLIDTAVSSDHPNLKGAINDELSIDFTIAPFRKSTGKDDEKTAMIIKDIETQIAVYISKKKQPRPDPKFGSHGTAMAGVIGARPAVTTQYRSESVALDGTKTAAQAVLMALPYAGVDPTCEIIPVAIGASPNPEQIVAAFKYAAALKPDLIVMATDLPNPLESQQPLEQGLREYTDAELEMADTYYSGTAVLEIKYQHLELWAYLCGEIPAISKKIPIIAAAGNVPHRVVFPANLAASDNGIFSVGAVRRDHLIASYSPGRELDHNVTVLAFSGDDERFDREEMRWDIYRDGFGEYDENPWKRSDASKYKPAEVTGLETLISTDVPGRFGYNGSSYGITRIDGKVVLKDVQPDAPDDEDTKKMTKILGKDDIEIYTEFASNFCRFSGTSAASALFGGLVSLGISSGILKPGFASSLKAVMRGQETRAVASWDDIVAAGKKVKP